MEQMNVKIKGVTDLIQNRKSFMLDKADNPSLEKQRGEDYTDLEKRTWRMKAHYDQPFKVEKGVVLPNEGNVIFPGEWLKRTMIASQARGKFPILPPGKKGKNDTMKPYFTSGILIDDNEIKCNGKVVKEKDLLAFRSVVVPPGQGSVICIRPLIKAPWTVDVTITITDEAISKKCLLNCLAWCGQYLGVGDFRPQRGGNFGKYEI
jgi:hypothetical protein